MSLFKILSHVSVTVTDVTKAREFYTGVLGFRRSRAPPSTSRASGTAWAGTCSSTSS